MNDFIVYKKFKTLENLTDLTALLEKNNIEYIVEDNMTSVDLTFLGSDTLGKEMCIKVHQSDFNKIDKLIEEYEKISYSDIDKDHYLQEFTNDELLEIMEKSDEWSKPDYAIAQCILNNRGIKITQEKIDQYKAIRLTQLSEPEKGKMGWIIAGYISAALGGVFGILFGWYLLSVKKTLPNGQRVYAYDIKARKHGERIFIIGIICLAYWIFYKIKSVLI